MQKIILQFYFVAFFLVLKALRENESDKLDQLVSLLELHFDRCNSVSLCTIRSENESSVDSTQTCCRQCSCDTTCEKMGTCCPDFRFVNGTNDITLRNKSDLSSQLNDPNITSRFSHNFEMNIQQNLGCVEANIMKKDIRFESPGMPSSYWMVNTCPQYFQDNKNTSRKCTDDNYHFLSENNLFDPDIIIPVTSLKTNKTYKNIYCYRCSELENSTNNLMHWKAVYVCANLKLPHLFENPYKILQTIATFYGVYSCSVLFKPRSQAQDLVTRCSLEDVTTCPENSNKRLDEICKAYYLPVIGVNGGLKFTKFRNIACYLCNEKDTFRSDCAHFYDGKVVSAEMNLLFDHHSAILRYNESDLHILNVSIAENSTCDTGFIPSYDKVTVKCKRVLCPKHFYPVDGTCIPAFTQTENIFFTVVLEVLRVQKLDEKTLKRFHRSYSDIIEQLAPVGFERFTYGLWQITNNYDCLVISFTSPKESPYVSTLTLLSAFLTKVAILEIDIQSEVVTTVTLVSKDTNLVFFGGNLYKKGKTRTPLPAIHVYDSIGKTLTEIRISSSHLCYRTEFDSSETYKDSVGNIRVYETGTILFTADFQLMPGGRVIACIDDVFSDLTTSNATYMLGISNTHIRAQYLKLKIAVKSGSEGLDNSYEHDNDGTGSTKEIVITVTLVSVVAIIFVVKILGHWRKRTSRGDAGAE